MYGDQVWRKVDRQDPSSPAQFGWGRIPSIGTSQLPFPQEPCAPREPRSSLPRVQVLPMLPVCHADENASMFLVRLLALGEPPLTVDRRLTSHSRRGDRLAIPPVDHVPASEHAFYARHRVLRSNSCVRRQGTEERQRRTSSSLIAGRDTDAARIAHNFLPGHQNASSCPGSSMKSSRQPPRRSTGFG